MLNEHVRPGMQVQVKGSDIVGTVQREHSNLQGTWILKIGKDEVSYHCATFEEYHPTVHPMVGRRVKLKNYAKHADWLKHQGEVGRIIEVLTSHPNYPTYLYKIQWPDGDWGRAPREQLLFVSEHTEPVKTSLVDMLEDIDLRSLVGVGLGGV